ncbi:MAG: GAF domain-containing protein [Chloroflexi bacterium]|nr:GAF domain-containing protein [Chloroflexota bacterium]
MEDHRHAELEQKVRELSTLLEVSRVINADLELERVLRTVLDQAIEVIQAEAGTLWILEEGGAVIVPRVTAGPVTSNILQVRLQPGEGITGRVIQTGVGDLVTDAQNDPRWAGRVDSATGFMTRSIISAPLTGRSGTIGCLQLVNKRGDRFFQSSDLDLLTALGAQAALVIENSRLLEETRALARSLQEAWTGALDALTAALATRDNDTQHHCYRTVELAVLLARRINVPEVEIPIIARGALLHDVGKIGIPDGILYKPGRLTPAEREKMKQHVRLGYDMLQHIMFFRDANLVVLYHHEDFDGSGYPLGLKGERIPVSARIFHVADVYDALTNERPYKEAWPHERALAELKNGSGLHFDPRVVTALESLTPEEVDWIHTLQSFSTATRDLLGRSIRYDHRP